MSRKKTKTIQIRLDDTLYELLRREAMQKQVPISELARNILITWYFAHDFIIKDIKEKILKE